MSTPIYLFILSKIIRIITVKREKSLKDVDYIFEHTMNSTNLRTSKQKLHNNSFFHGCTSIIIICWLELKHFMPV